MVRVPLQRCCLGLTNTRNRHEGFTTPHQHRRRNGGAQRGGDQLRATLSVSGRARSCWAPGDEGGPHRVVGGVCSMHPMPCPPWCTPSRTSALRLPGFESQLCHLHVVSPQASSLCPLASIFLYVTKQNKKQSITTSVLLTFGTRSFLWRGLFCVL